MDGTNHYTLSLQFHPNNEGSQTHSLEEKKNTLSRDPNELHCRPETFTIAGEIARPITALLCPNVQQW
jgi:hypothetical protein